MTVTMSIGGRWTSDERWPVRLLRRLGLIHRPEKQRYLCDDGVTRGWRRV